MWFTVKTASMTTPFGFIIARFCGLDYRYRVAIKEYGTWITFNYNHFCMLNITHTIYWVELCSVYVRPKSPVSSVEIFHLDPSSVEIIRSQLWEVCELVQRNGWQSKACISMHFHRFWWHFVCKYTQNVPLLPKLPIFAEVLLSWTAFYTRNKKYFTSQHTHITLRNANGIVISNYIYCWTT